MFYLFFAFFAFFVFYNIILIFYVIFTSKNNQEKTIRFQNDVLELQLKNYKVNEEDNYEIININENIIEAKIIGTKGSLYENGIFKIKIFIPMSFPYEPPKVKFITKIMHPNIDENGYVHIDILNKKWTPAICITSLLTSLLILLNEPDYIFSINDNCKFLYKKNKVEYENKVKKYVEQYAI